MSTSITDLLAFMEDNDVKFIRLAFCDLFGTQKNISISPAELLRAISEGIAFDASALEGFLHVDSCDLLLFPDPSTLCILPWRPSTGRVVRFFCSIRFPDGTPFEGDGRHLLAEAERAAQAIGLSCVLGVESEFYLFTLDEEGAPTRKPNDRASHFDVSPLDKGENVRRQICMTLEEMGIQPETSHHEKGPGQNEIDFKYAAPLQAADHFITFKWVVKTMAQASDLFASFLPKPLAGEPGSGLHINLSLLRKGKNVLQDPRIAHSAEGEAFIAGILMHARALTLFCSPLVNSYDRLGEFDAPQQVTWSHQNRSPLIRIPTAHGVHRCIEYRGADGTLNPYLAFSLLIRAGLDGIARGLTLPAPCDERTPSAAYQSLPRTLEEAVTAAFESDFVRAVLPAPVLEAFCTAKRRAWENRHHSPHDFDRY